MPKDKTAIAKLRKDGKNFEVLIYPEQAQAFRAGKNVSINDVLATDQIFVDARKGERASEHEMEKIFGTTDATAIATQIIKEGNVPVTEDMIRSNLDQKRKQIINLIHRNTINPTTNKPHPPQRIETAMNEAKVRINEKTPAEAQIQDVIKQLQHLLPIKYETRELLVKIPMQYAARSATILRQHGKILNEQWNTDGSLSARIEIPAGLQEEFETSLNAIAHGNAEIKIISAH